MRISKVILIGACAVQFLHYAPLYRNTQHNATLNGRKKRVNAPESHNSILRAQAHNKGYCAMSDNARRRSKPRRSRGVADAQSRRSRDVAEAKPRRIRGAISPASMVASLVISRIVCIGTYSILCDFGAYTGFHAYNRI